MNVKVPGGPGTLRGLREAKGLTREQLAVQAGVSSSTLYLAERAGLLSRSIAGRLAEALGCTVDEVIQFSRVGGP